MNSSSVQIKKATESDAADILKMIKALAVYEKLEHEVVNTEEKIRNTLFGPKAAAEVYFIIEGQVKAGYALFFQSYSTFLGQPGIYLEDLFVLPEFRGKGYGKKLLSYLAKLVVERNGGRLEWSVLDWNKPAIDFYLSLGAKPLDEWTVQRLTGEALIKLSQSYRE